MRIGVEKLDHIVWHCADVQATADWYERVFDVDVVRYGKGGDRVALHFGSMKINLRPHETDQTTWGTSKNVMASTADVCFCTTLSLDEAAEALVANGVEIVEGPIVRSGTKGEILSLYCYDFDGNLIEISRYLE